MCFDRFILVAAMLCTTVVCFSQDINNLKLKNYHPVSIYKVPQTTIQKAKYPVIDMHAHDYPKSDSVLDAWVKTTIDAGITKTIILSNATGARIDSVFVKYARYKDRFEIWCGFDYAGFGKPGWQDQALKELERCYKNGAKGVGELSDKGMGLLKSDWGYNLHVDDPCLEPLFKKCAELKMPVNVHIAEDEWMYRNIDSTNDGLMNAATWKIDITKKGIFNHDQLITTLENVLKKNPATTFIACHFANCCSNLSVLGRLLDTYPNLYTDTGARFGEIAPVPRYAHDFIEKYQDRILYGTDMGIEKEMYSTTFRILETADEHFYKRDIFNYHWPLYGLLLSKKTLKKIYENNAKKISRP